MSLYADYIKEREGFETLETELGFATYKFGKEECYVRDVYIQPQYRQANIASKLVDTISDIAKKHGYKYISTSVVPSMKGSTDSTKAILKYGFQLLRSEDNMLWFLKELK